VLPKFSGMSSTPSSSAVSAAANAFATLSLGRSANAIDLLVPTAPPVHAAADLKARCFDCLSDLLVEHAPLYSSAELIAAFSHIPSSSYNAVLESTSVCNLLYSAFFQIENLVGLGFRDHQGVPISTSITSDPTTRPTGISYFAFRSTVIPAVIDSRIALPGATFEFLLALPQTNLNSSAPSSNRTLLGQFDSLGTPAAAAAAPVPLISAAQLEAMDQATFDALGCTDSSDTLADYETSCYTHFSPGQLQILLLRNVSAPVPTFAAIISPRMTAVLASGGSSGGFSYHGSLDFLDHQPTFDSTFPTPTPLLVTASNIGASVDTISIRTAMNLFVDQCKFCVFVPIFRCDYVGTADRNDSMSLHATVQSLKKLSMSHRNSASGQWTNLTPDELFAEYSALTPLLPNRVALWGLNLVTQFHDALSSDLQEMLLADTGFTVPDLSTLTSRASQLAALRSIRVVAVRHYTLMKAQEKLVARTIARKMKNSTFSAPLLASASTLATPPLPTATTYVSPAEQTMQRYQPGPSPSASPTFPVDPATNFRSCYPVGFAGCMFCGAADHVFRACPQCDAPGASQVFYKHLFAHKPHLRKRPPQPSDMVQPSSAPAPSTAVLPPTQSFPSATLPLPPLSPVPIL
jgi:hypothetical protein